MATIQTTQFGSSTCPQVQLVVTLSTTTTNTTTLTWTLKWVTYGYTFNTSNAKSYSVTIGGSTVKSGTFDINGKSSTTIASGTQTVTKGTSAKSLSFGLSFAFNASWSGTYAGTKTASGSISVPAKPSYKITYAANGGSGAPSTQTKWYGTSVTLSSTKPTRTGYTFSKWNTNSAGTGTSYAAGATYSTNAALTLYAIWTKLKYTVAYNANGGSGAPSSQTKYYGSDLTLSSTKPTRTNYTFKGWATSSTGAVSYAAGATYKANAGVTLYAVWELTYTTPVISDLNAVRCDESGTANETGTYAKLTFDWSTCQVSGNTATVSVIAILYLTAGGNYNETVEASGSSGSVSQVIGHGDFSVDDSYGIVVSVTDSKNGSTSKKYTLSGSKFPVDFKSGGTGVAFGKPADTDDLFDVNYDAYMRKALSTFGKTYVKDDIVIDNKISITGVNTSGTAIDLLQLNGSNNTVLGYGGYSNSAGSLNMYGNRIYLYSKGYVRSNRAPEVLWSGVYYMTDTQTASLSANVSAQLSGIVLHWQHYDATNKAALNDNHVYHFIPKTHVSSYAGKGVSLWLNNSSGTVVATKYVYINNASITGHSANDDDTTARSDSGVTTQAKYWVLTQVLGV